MRRQGGERGLAVAGDEQREKRDMARLARRKAVGEGGGGHRLARRRALAAFQMRMRLGGMRQRKARVGGDGGCSNAAIAPGYIVSLIRAALDIGIRAADEAVVKGRP